MTTATGRTWRLFDIYTGHRATDYLRASRQSGLTYEQIAERITQDMQLPVSREWVRQQCVRLGINPDVRDIA